MKRCPICGKKVERLLALSRADNRTMICDDCSVVEAMADFAKFFKKEEESKEACTNG